MELHLANCRNNTRAMDAELTGGIDRTIALGKQVYKPTEWNSRGIALKGPRLKVTLNRQLIWDVNRTAFERLLQRHDAAPHRRSRTGHAAGTSDSIDSAATTCRGRYTTPGP